MTALLTQSKPILPKRQATVDELMAIPDDGIERWIVDGEIVEMSIISKEYNMTVRNKTHTRIESILARILGNWSENQSSPHGAIYSGEVGVLLQETPRLVVGIDVVYISPQQVIDNDSVVDTTLLVAPITLGVEILSPTDTVELVGNKVKQLLENGVALVWTVNPHFQTITEHRLKQLPLTYNMGQTLIGGIELPGLSLPVKNVFQS